MKIIIVGSGIAGLSFAYEAIKKKHNVTIIEKSNNFGGLCRSFKKNNCILDLGVHLFHGRDPSVINLAKEVVDLDKWIHVKRIGKLYILGKHITWPIKFISFLQLPLSLSIGILFDQFKLVFFKKKLNNKKNYENEILGLYGNSLLINLFKPLTEKFFKVKSSQIHSDWAFSSIRSATKIEDAAYKESSQYLIRDTASDAKKSFNIFRFVLKQLFDSFKKEDFYYFKDGYGTLANGFVKHIKKKGGSVVLNKNIQKIHTKSKKITHISINGKKEVVDHIVWTGNLENLCDLLKISKPKVKRLHSKFIYVFLNKCLKDHQVCYYADLGINFVRGTILSNHYKGIINNKNIDSVLCLEYTSLTYDSSDNVITDNEYEKMVADLKKVGLIKSDEDIEDIYLINVPNTYPIFTKNYRSEIDKVKKEISKYKNLTLFGRQGSFSYENADGLIHDALNHPLLHKK